MKRITINITPQFEKELLLDIGLEGMTKGFNIKVKAIDRIIAALGYAIRKDMKEIKPLTSKEMAGRE